MTHTLMTVVTTLLAVVAALEHLPRALTRVVRACMPLVQAWRELKCPRAEEQPRTQAGTSAAQARGQGAGYGRDPDGALDRSG